MQDKTNMKSHMKGIWMRFNCNTVIKHKEKNNFTYKKRTHNASNKAYGEPSDSSTKAECWGIQDLNKKTGKRGCLE